MAADAAAHAGHAKPHHDYHLVNPSPWPLVGSISAFLLAIGGIAYMKTRIGQEFAFLGIPLGGPWLLLIGAVGVLYTMYAWWSDVIAEGQHGDHTPVVRMHHRYGMMLFIASEVMFFVAWFWAYFDQFFRHADPEQVTRTAFMGTQWPPHGVELFDPFHLPLFNTLLLLTSGTTGKATMDSSLTEAAWGALEMGSIIEAGGHRASNVSRHASRGVLRKRIFGVKKHLRHRRKWRKGWD